MLSESRVLNSLFVGNDATTNFGSAIYGWKTNLTVVNSTITDNELNLGMAILNIAPISIYNSIIANHDVALAGAGGASEPVEEDYNVFAGNTRKDLMYNRTPITHGANSILAPEARFVDPQAGDYSLMRNSPGADSGDDQFLTQYPVLSSDLVGQARPFGNTAVDIGAYETQDTAVASVAIEKTGPPWATTGQPVGFALVASNPGKLTASNLVVTETLPAGATYVTDSASDGGVYSNGVLTWDIGTLSPGESVRVSYEVTTTQDLVSDDYRIYSSSNPLVTASGPTLETPLNTNVIAFFGFLPNPDGFAFYNYTDSPDSDLTVDDMVAIYGADQVCKSQNPCVLTATAEAWRVTWLDNVKGGHCAGMSMASLDIFANPNVAPSDFQASADVTFELEKPNVRRHIGLYAMTQATIPTNYIDLSVGGVRRVPAVGPTDVLDTLIENFNAANPTDRYRVTIGRHPSVHATEGGGWHAVVPYAVEQINSDEYLIYVYENNDPGSTTRAFRINRATDTWQYVFTTAPTETYGNYYGTTADGNLRLRSWVWASTFPKVCDEACSPQATPDTDMDTAGDAQVIDGEMISFQLGGEGHLLITRNDGLRFGYDVATESWINEIEGAEQELMTGGLDLNIPPILRIPHVAGATYGIQVSNRETALGNTTATANVNIFGGGLAIRLTDLPLNSPELTPVEFNETADVTGMVDTAVAGHDQVGVTFAPEQNRVVFETSSLDGDTPGVSMAVGNPDGSDYSFTVADLGLDLERSMAVTFNRSSGVVAVENNDSQNDDYTVEVVRTNLDGTQDTFTDAVSDGNGVGFTLDVGSGWDGAGAPQLETLYNPSLPQDSVTIYLPLIAR